MRNLLVIIFVSAQLIGLSQAENSSPANIKKLYNDKKYDKIIKDYGAITAEAPATSNYYLAMSYYMKGNLEDALSHLNYSIEKDSEKWETFYTKGQLLNNMQRYSEARVTFQKASMVNKEDSYIYNGLGDANFALGNYQEALDAYNKAVNLEQPLDHTYLMIAEVYKALNDEEKTLQSYYKAKDNVDKTSEPYFLLLDNIGTYEINKGNYEKANVVYMELNRNKPNNYYYVTKLIQINYGLQKYEKAKTYKATLYEAKQKGLLPEKLQELFCFDQFLWKGKRIFAYEYFEQKIKNKDPKHVFYLINEETHEIEKQIYIKNSEKKKSKSLYGDIVSMNKGKVYASYEVKYKKNSEAYESLKSTVLDVLEDKQPPINTALIR